jgi:predicted transcriptional regulator
MGVLEKIKEIEAEMARTQKNKVRSFRKMCLCCICLSASRAPLNNQVCTMYIYIYIINNI